MTIEQQIIEDNGFDGCIGELESYDFSQLPETAEIQVDCDTNQQDYFPVSTIKRENDNLVVEVTKMVGLDEPWFEVYSPKYFCDRLIQAVKKLNNEGKWQISNGGYEILDSNEVCIWWTIILPSKIKQAELKEKMLSSIEVVLNKTKDSLNHSDTVLILGKDTDDSYNTLKNIEQHFKEKGYYTIIIKDTPDKPGESVIQKVLRHASVSKFIVIENTEPSGHLYEVPHVVKDAEAITAVIQENGKGATWMFEELYNKMTTIKKFVYEDNINAVLNEAEIWAVERFEEFKKYQEENIPWFKK